MNIISAIYSGRDIIKGTLNGVIKEEFGLEFGYNHVNNKHEIREGQCITPSEILSDGRIRLYENWKWLDSEGHSIIEEIRI